ncbi:ABC transporter ATP-binding protein/permease [Rhodococcus tukisamuensis]|uniref:Putative ATP-binding cassette transporter n=1 Tax=Rhodococcus tukisamuensis TaxID=168276 RepID=A0A1G6Z1D8_9NOCA|nr:ABC transporter ATP-binding protein/permease [Rhodococcus tukisamuensis]SDD96564.1 putative ATP-binding cassette transporter [Rhodococcus tukisamuensis]
MSASSGLDWNNEALHSLIWTLEAFAITAVCLLIVAWLLARMTRWGRQFWRISGGYYTGRGSWRVYALLSAVLFLTVFAVRMTVLFSYQGNEMYTALQMAAQAYAQGDTDALDLAKAAFWHSLLVFGILATIHVVRSLVDYYVGQAFDIRWRLWMTEHVTTDWLDGRAFYRGRFVDAGIDNPDQRIETDITNFVQTSRTLSMGAVGALVSLVSFTRILWDLSGPMTVWGNEIPRAMVFLVFAYVLVSTIVAFWIGRPLIRLNFWNEQLTANFRYALVRVRDGAENVAFYRGEGVERHGLLTRFAAVIANFWRIVFRTLKFSGWNLVVNQISVVFAFVIQAPRFFAGTITLGDMTQSSTAFGQVHDSLSFFRESYDVFAGYRASLIRLSGLLDADRHSRELPTIETAELASALELSGVQVRRPDGQSLIADLNLAMAPGDTLVVKGRSGSGKTTLLRSLAAMWPYTEGVIRRPLGDDTLFLSQMPYLPLGDLRTAVAYPGTPDLLDDEVIRETLRKVQLGNLVDRLDEQADWVKILSPGEQQRIAFARIVLIRPKLAFLDEATSAVDEGLEYALYDLIRTEVPECMLVSVSHRSTVDRHHSRQLELDGDGPWELSPVPA